MAGLSERIRLAGLFAKVAWADVAHVPGVREARLTFGPSRELRALAFVPAEPAEPAEQADPSLPWVYFLYGGGWQSGDPRAYVFVGRFLAAHGIPAVLGDYRHAPEHRFPAQLDDAVAGLAATVAHAEELGLAGRPVVFSGFSAGGHLVTLMALDPARLAAERLPSPAGLLLLAAPLDFSAYPGSRYVATLMGRPGPWPESDPLTRLRAASVTLPPMLLVHGSEDALVTRTEQTRFAETAAALGSDTRVLDVPGVGHAELVSLVVEDGPRAGEVLRWLRDRRGTARG